MLREAITINKNLDARWSLGENYNNLGKQYYYAQRYQESLEALDVARGYADQIGARELISDNYEYRAMVFAAMKRYEQAYHALEEMYRLKGELQNTNRLRSLEQEIAYKQYTEQGISSIRVYATLLCIKHLIPNDRHWTEFVDTIDLLFEKYPHADKKLMGFPDDWADVLRS